ncbi:hypothetical protein BDR26DRAFT_25366 [Obelidium mucronatum]|nr:hypothetical protein BDR26DRAFT_25366 [Obelidium mucronatum]
MITPKTLTLLLLGMSGTAYFIAHGFFFYSMSSSARVASNCLFVVYQAITLIYSWIRASEVFRRNVSNSVYMTFQCILCVGVAFMVVPLVLALLDNVGKEWTLLAIGISVCCVFALDLFYSYNYIRKIFEITLQIVDLKGMETRSILYFGIIARYGIVTSCLMLLGCGWFWAYVWFTRFPTRSVYLFAASVILMDLFLYLVGLSLFLMKARMPVELIFVARSLCSKPFKIQPCLQVFVLINDDVISSPTPVPAVKYTNNPLEMVLRLHDDHGSQFILAIISVLSGIIFLAFIHRQVHDVKQIFTRKRCFYFRWYWRGNLLFCSRRLHYSLRKHRELLRTIPW